MSSTKDPFDGLVQHLLSIHGRLIHLSTLMDNPVFAEAEEEDESWCFGDVDVDAFPHISPEPSLSSLQFESPCIYASRGESTHGHVGAPREPTKTEVALERVGTEDEDEDAEQPAEYVRDGWCVSDDEEDIQIAANLISRIRDAREERSQAVRQRRVLCESESEDEESTAVKPTTRTSRAAVPSGDHKQGSAKRIDRFAEADSDASEDLDAEDEDEDDEEEDEDDENASFVVDDSDQECDVDWRQVVDDDDFDESDGRIHPALLHDSDEDSDYDDAEEYDHRNPRKTQKSNAQPPTTPTSRKLPPVTPSTLDKYRSRTHTPHRTAVTNDPYLLTAPSPRLAASATPSRVPRSAQKHARAQANDVVCVDGKTFVRQREAMARTLYSEFNTRAFAGQLPADLEIQWSPRLLTTAGQAVFKRLGSHTRTSHIVLSTKVIDDSVKLRNTLCHEMCHVAAWVIDGVMKPPHGGAFQQWAARAMKVYPDLDITTCHNYEIFYKHKYQCINDACGQEYGRHSKSIDTARARCHRCGSDLTYLGNFNRDGTPAKARAPSEYNKFVQQNSARLRERHRGATQQELMAIMAAEYKQMKSQQNTPAAGVTTERVFVAASDDDEEEMTALVKQLHF